MILYVQLYNIICRCINICLIVSQGTAFVCILTVSAGSVRLYPNRLVRIFRMNAKNCFEALMLNITFQELLMHPRGESRCLGLAVSVCSL